MRRFAKDGVIVHVGRTFILDADCSDICSGEALDAGLSTCVYTFMPMSGEEAADLDDADRKQGVAMHQHGIGNAVVEKAWQWAGPEEMVPHLPCREYVGDPWSVPTDPEIEIDRMLEDFGNPANRTRWKTCHDEEAYRMESAQCMPRRICFGGQTQSKHHQVES